METPLLVQMVVVDCHTWKQLKQHNEHAKEIIARVGAKESNPRSERSLRRAQDQSLKAKKKETLATKAKPSQGTQPIKGGGAPTTRGSGPANQICPSKQYSFKDEHVDSLFKLLNKRNRLKLPKPRRPEEIGKNE